MNHLNKFSFAVIAAVVVLSTACQRRDDPSTNGPTGAGNASTTNSSMATPATPPASAASQ